MSLATLDLLAPVLTTLIASHAGALDRLGIHYTGARLGISLLAHPQTLLRKAAWILSKVPSLRHILR
jgi:hypothetical protein